MKMTMEEECKTKKIENHVLDTTYAERSMWLMKCSSLVVSSLQPIPSPHGPYRTDAKVVLSVDLLAPENEDTKFEMELARAEIANMPRRYTLDMSKEFVPMYIFSESLVGKPPASEGKIKNKFDMRPHNANIENYGKLCRERSSKSMSKSKQIQVIDNANGMHMRPMPGMIIPTATPEKRKAISRTSETKRTRRDQREMEEIMFNLFERQSNWTLRQLIQETDQPEQFMKDLLKDLCIYNNKGSNQGTYELKPEYKRTTQD